MAYILARTLCDILSTPEVQLFMKQENVAFPFDFESGPGARGGASPGSAHVSGNLKDITLHQALDRVLGTFPGLWVYENCPSTKSNRVVYFNVYENGPVWPILNREGGRVPRAPR